MILLEFFHHVAFLSFNISGKIGFCSSYPQVFLLSQISRNITTNEMANAMRYNYLRGPGGRFRNPYDHGMKKNCSDFFIKGYNEDVELIEESARDEGTGMRHMHNSNLQNGDSHSHHTNGNGHVAINVNSSAPAHHGHVHSAHCSHNNHGKTKTDNVPLGLGLGLGRNASRSDVS